MTTGPGIFMRVDNLIRKGNESRKTGLYIYKSEEMRGWPTCGWNNEDGRLWNN
jgi:hypothetical protein